MTWTIYTFGDGDLVAAILNGVKLMVSGGMGSLSTAAALAGVAVALASAAVRTAPWRQLGSWFLGLVLVIWGLLAGTVTVTVEDVVDARIAPQVIADLPILIAVPAALSSDVSYNLTKLASNLPLGGELGDPGTSLARPTMALQALLDADLAVNADLAQNTVTYIETCIIPEIPGPIYTDKGANQASDLLAYLRSDNYAVSLPVYVDGQMAYEDLCPNVYASVIAPGYTLANPEYKRAVDLLACQLPGGRGLMTGGTGACQNPPLPWDEVQAALQALQLSAVDAETAFRNVLLTKQWKEASKAWTRETNDLLRLTELTTQAVADQQTLQAYAGQALGRRNLLRQLRGLADGLVYFSSPLILVAALSPAVFRMLGLYVRLYIWLMLWGPMMAGAQYLVTTQAVSTLTATATASGDLLGVVRGNWWALVLQTAQINATATDILFAVPAVALGAAWSGVSGLGALIGGIGQHTLETTTGAMQTLQQGGQVLTRQQQNAILRTARRSGIPLPEESVATMGFTGPHITGVGGTDVWASASGHNRAGRTQVLDQQGRVIATTFQHGLITQQITERGADGRTTQRTTTAADRGGPLAESDVIALRDTGALTDITKDPRTGFWEGQEIKVDPHTRQAAMYKYMGASGIEVTYTNRDKRTGELLMRRTERHQALPGGQLGPLVSGESVSNFGGYTIRDEYDGFGRGHRTITGVTHDGYSLNASLVMKDGRPDKGSVTLRGNGNFWIASAGGPRQVTGEFTSVFKMEDGNLVPESGTTTITGQRGEHVIARGDAFKATQEHPAPVVGDINEVLKHKEAVPGQSAVSDTVSTPEGSQVYREVNGVINGLAGKMTLDKDDTPVNVEGRSGYNVTDQAHHSFVVKPDTPAQDTTLYSGDGKTEFFKIMPGATVERTGGNQATIKGLMLMRALVPENPGDPQSGHNDVTVPVFGKVQASRDEKTGQWRVGGGQVQALVKGDAAADQMVTHDRAGMGETAQAPGAASVRIDPRTASLLYEDVDAGKSRKVDRNSVTINFGGVEGTGWASRKAVEAAEAAGKVTEMLGYPMSKGDAEEAVALGSSIGGSAKEILRDYDLLSKRFKKNSKSQNGGASGGGGPSQGAGPSRGGANTPPGPQRQESPWYDLDIDK